MKYQTYIFDLDGTLINSIGDLAASTNHALRSSGYPERSTDEVRRFIGNGVHKLIERAVPTTATRDDISRVYNIFSQYYLAYGTANTHPYDG
ncbi:MAG: HAD hydrolase-like protein, partial [Prevotella sp.]|nr:HAD hydrolase-like protein [Prevotella sp.]